MREHSAHETYRFTVITPVHIGSGVKLGKTDIARQGSLFTVVDMESVFSRFKGDLSVFDDVFENRDFDLFAFLKSNRIPLNEVKKYSIANPDNIRFASEILEMIKTGMGNPLIPGSSIKGAIRTVIWWHLVRSEEKQPLLKEELKKVINSKSKDLKEQRADDELDKKLFGKDPNHDFMRGLQVGDVEFTLSDMKLVESKVLNLTKENGFGWKFTICSESLKSGVASAGKMKIEDFLFDDLAKHLNFSDDKKELLANLPEKCNEFARTFIADEIAFFESCNMKEMITFYEGLQKEIPADNSSFLLHLGWGSGWRGMTGNYLEKDDVVKLRKRFGLGKLLCPQCGKEAKKDKREEGMVFCRICKKNFPTELFPVFPKTRKIAFQNGNSAYPPGWIKICLLSASADNKPVLSEKPQAVSESRQSGGDKERISVGKPALKQTASSAPAARPQEPMQTELMQNFQDFRLNPSPEGFAEFAEQITAEESEELKNISLKNLGIHIGYAGKLLSSSVPDEIKKLLAAKLLEVIQKSDKWNAKKQEAYNKLQLIA